MPKSLPLPPTMGSGYQGNHCGTGSRAGSNVLFPTPSGRAVVIGRSDLAFSDRRIWKGTKPRNERILAWRGWNQLSGSVFLAGAGSRRNEITRKARQRFSWGPGLPSTAPNYGWTKPSTPLLNSVPASFVRMKPETLHRIKRRLPLGLKPWADAGEI